MSEKIATLKKKPVITGKIYTVNTDGTVRLING